MIDVDWFARICSIAAPGIEAREQGPLCDLLGEQEEVLPYLLVTAGGFPDWPKARAALRKAAKSVSRPSHVRPAAASDPAAEKSRREMRESLEVVLRAFDTSKTADGMVHSIRTAERLIGRHGARLPGKALDPNPFIALD